ncbi:hypothetical protein PoB_005753800 [Plakobranchus ocellatus]|uniref:Uncharacterized protein n=1 Tax=Plakobranchus ocellatus TaxID=259542 RepID=A0AAV4CIY5_9GAST|nr:hypothetical protein PoB_005753800 [Plakobranchus ocellatus]
MRRVLGFSSRAPHPPRSPTRGTRCTALQRCVRATLELFPQQRDLPFPPIRIALHRKQGAHTVGVGLSITASTGGLRWIEVEDSMRRSGRDNSAGKEVGIED